MKQNVTVIGRALYLSALATILLLAACGGGSMTPKPAGNATPSAVSILASQVFSNVPQTWVFTSQCREGGGGAYVTAMTTIDVIPQADGSSVWHYTKDHACAYWTPGAADATLDFNLAVIDGRWYSTGGHVIWPSGAPWDATPRDFAYTVTPDPGKPRPYLIIGDSGTTVNTTWTDATYISVPNTAWSTKMYVENGELISEQNEGPCIHEKWHFAIGRGLVKVEPLDTGNCVPTDPKLTMTRIN